MPRILKLSKKVKEILVFFIVLMFLGFAAFIELNERKEMVLTWEANNGKGKDYYIFSSYTEDDLIKIDVIANDEIGSLRSGKEILVSHRLIGSEIKALGRDNLNKSNYLFLGRTVKKIMGVDIPIDGKFKLIVEQNNESKIYNFDAEWFYAVLQKGAEAKLIFQRDSYVTKELVIYKKADNDRYSTFISTCVFNEGVGHEKASMNLDSVQYLN